MAKRVLAFDFGASSGRAMLGTNQDGIISMQEIHRFSNDPVSVRGTLYWDVLRLYHEILTGIQLAVQQGGFDALGIDTWGVDFGLLDNNGNLLSNPVHYRDERTVHAPKQVFEAVSQSEIYQRTGIQFMRINTLYQLQYLKKNDPELLDFASHLLMIPDLFAYFLTGEKRSEETIVSTSNLLSARGHKWDTDLMHRLGLPTDCLAPMIEPGEIYGTISEEICDKTGCGPVPVVAVCCHDTASAVVSVPSTEEDFAYISCGTWSLFGTELSAPIMTKEAEQANFTNEGGFDHTTRFLKNIMGLWVIQESRRQWQREGQTCGYDTLENEALEADTFRCYIEMVAPEFELPGNLPKRIQEYCRKTGQFIPQTRGEIMRCIYQSLAMKYRYTFETLQRLTGKAFRHIHMIGGGIKDTLLCRMTADSCNTTVVSGPAEATAMGNIAVQLIALGELSSLNEARKTIINSISSTTYRPVQPKEWEEAYQAYLAGTERKDS